jgi:V/A-type H+-transporting ATPase subunit K
MKKRILLVTAILSGLALFTVTAQTEVNSATPSSIDSTAAYSAEQSSGSIAQTGEAPAKQAEVKETAKDSSAIKYIAAGLAVGLACLAGGMAVGKIGAAAMGAMSENAELSGKALPFVGLAEGICLWGFLVALLIIIL